MRKYNRKNKRINGYSKNIENDTEIFLKPAFDNNNIALAMSSSNEYAPYVSVLIQSIIDNAKSSNNYDILVLNKDISDNNKKLISEHMNAGNISVRFVDTNKYLNGRTLHTQGLAIETYFRFFLLDIKIGRASCREGV